MPDLSGASDRAAKNGIPRRIQLRRTKGWRKPEGAVVVSRPTRWGNPIRVLGAHTVGPHWADVRANFGRAVRGPADVLYSSHSSEQDAVEHAVHLFRILTKVEQQGDPVRFERWLAPLRGHDLACWCPLPAPGEPDWCHAAVLLELANAGES